MYLYIYIWPSELFVLLVTEMTVRNSARTRGPNSERNTHYPKREMFFLLPVRRREFLIVCVTWHLENSKLTIVVLAALHLSKITCLHVSAGICMYLLVLEVVLICIQSASTHSARPWGSFAEGWRRFVVSPFVVRRLLPTSNKDGTNIEQK